MHRRGAIRFLAVAAAALFLAWPLGSGAQPAGNIKRIRWIAGSADAVVFRPRLSCFSEALRARGWVEGQTVTIDVRGAEGGGFEKLLELAEEAARTKPDVIISSGTPATKVVKRAVRDIPVVFLMVSDPVESGIVANLARPEANVTGLSNFLPATTGKLLEFVRELAPAARRVAVVYDPANAGKRIELEVLRKSARSLSMTIDPHPLRSTADIESTFAALRKAPPHAFIIPTDNVTLDGLPEIVAHVAKARRPAIYQTREYVEAGGLMSYGLDVCQHFRSAAAYVDKILKGARPADIPVERASTFELVINRGTANALGITIPAVLLTRADRVIE
ncbi:MAG TPA: ABC transporter substrate-binding protein [Burkholderiales bacterium]|nr:ABC transporter substrate-binding protein [Burkholderiales bacterium]